MRVLVIGCGYVGLPLGAELVRQGHTVYGLRRSTSGDDEIKSAGIQPLHGDITKPEDLRKLPNSFDWVVNCAASGGGTAEDYRQLYLQGTKNALAWLTPPQKYVYTSSTSVYGQLDGSVVTEASPAEPNTETSRVLVETENFLLDAAKRNFPAIVLRVAGIYGPERGHWFKQFLRDEAKISGTGELFLNMVHRDDVVGSIIAALEKGRAGEIYNVTDDEPVKQIDFFRWLAETLKKDMPPSVPEDENVDRKRGVTNKRVSNQKLKEELSYQSKYPTFREGYGREIKKLSTAPV